MRFATDRTVAVAAVIAVTLTVPSPVSADQNLPADAMTLAARTAVEKMTDAALSVEGPGGFCGTANTSGAWARDMQNALQKTLSSPRFAKPATADPNSPNSYGDYSRIAESLDTWALGGLFEFHALQNYKAQFDQTVGALTALYGTDFHMKPWPAASAARSSLRNALSYGFGFYMYHSYTPDEATYRRTILEHRPLDPLKSLPLSLPGLETPDSDSILDIAVDYPAALQFLIKNGADPNFPNAFGKTPLMYAVQNNQLQSAQILLDAGADPNAVTIRPSDTCEYPLQTTNVTALDYAVRYASEAVIELLLAHGAVTYIPSAGFGEVAGYPLDWLQKYAATGRGGEHNGNISAREVPELEYFLQVPTDAQRRSLASKLVLGAESRYAAHQPQLVLRKVRLALAADPHNARAINDLPLIALRANDVDVALQGSQLAIATLKAPADQAAAWFNQGLACEQAKGQMVIYNGAAYCEGGPIPAFVHAWQEQPTPARLSRLEEALREDRPGRCNSGSGPSSITYQFVLQRIYALHPIGQQIDPRSISWAIRKWGDARDMIVNPRIVDTLNLGAEGLTIMESSYSIRNPIINGKECKF